MIPSVSESKKSAAKISQFPEFTKLEVAHKKSIDEITSRFEPYSDFTFVNLFTWSLEGHTEVALHNGNLVVRLPDYMTGETIYSLLGDNKVDESIDRLLTLSDSLSLVPGVVATSIVKPSRYILTEDRDGDDYMYAIETISCMPGIQLKKKRNKLNRFLKVFGDVVTTETLSNIDLDTAGEIRQVFDEWSLACHKTPEESHAERIAIDRLVSSWNELGLQIMIARIDGKICAFSVNEVIGNGYAVCHFEKALPIHEGLYAFIIHYAAQVLESQGVKRVNWEQDLGLPGLRQAKTSYNPTGFLKKYSITLA